MKILSVCPTRLDPSLGIAKVYIESSLQYHKLGVDANIVGTECYLNQHDSYDFKTTGERLKDYLETHAVSYDVVEFEHHQLPYLPKFKSGKKPLLVARSSLLMHFLWDLERYGNGKLDLLKYPLRLFKTYINYREIKKLADKTIVNSDLILLANQDEVSKLCGLGFEKGKLVLSPFGIDEARRKVLLSSRAPKNVKVGSVVMVGTLDPRKGLKFLPKLFNRLLEINSSADFTLLGTGFFIPNLTKQFEFFAPKVRERLTIRQTFNPDELPYLLGDKQVGIFPSVWEGCPFGVMEMLASGLDVIGFDSPGVRMVLERPWLVQEGNLNDFVNKVLTRFGQIESEPRSRLRPTFYWENICKSTLDNYQSLLLNRYSTFANKPLK